MNERRQGNAVTPLTFQVLGNGKSLWKSGPMRFKGALEECEVSLEGVSELELRVDCPGADNWAVAAWFEPTLYFLDSAAADDPVGETKPESPEVELSNTTDAVARHWQKGDNRGNFSYEPSTQTISVDSPHELGTIVYNRRWNVLEFEIRAKKLSFGRFDATINNNTLKLGESVLGRGDWKNVRIEFDSSTRSLRAYVDGNIITTATVLTGNLADGLQCRLTSYGGQNAVFDLRNLKIQ